MKRIGCVMILLCACLMTQAQTKKHSVFNYGVKAGFCSSIYEVQKLRINNMPINESTSNSTISWLATVFGRVNMKRHYIQTEVTYNESRYSVSLPTHQWNSQAGPNDMSLISTTIRGIEVPLYYGYTFLQEGPYEMSFFVGPKAKFILAGVSNHNFENFDYVSIYESIKPVNLSMMLGLGINIGPTFFDFSFEIGLNNISNYFETTNKDGITKKNDLIFDRRKNGLIFTIGFMF